MSKLHEILEDQLAEARLHAGTKIVRKLYRGLRIEITCMTSVVHLTITRDDQYPSMQEWETITKHFPYQVPKVEPTPSKQGSRFTITARFPSERTIQDKFF